MADLVQKNMENALSCIKITDYVLSAKIIPFYHGKLHVFGFLY